MSDRQQIPEGKDEAGDLLDKQVSRRDFLKMAGVAGAALGVGAGLGGILASCGGGTAETTTTSAAAASTTTTAAAVTTTVTAAVETGKEIKIGWPVPKTGVLAPFANVDAYATQRFAEWVGDGQVLGDKKKHPISVILADTQSDPNRASQVAGDLINNDSVHILLASSSPDNVNPIAAQAEAGLTPCFSTGAPYQAFLGGAPTAGYKWTWHYFFGVEDTMANYIKIWQLFPTNKKMAVMWPNDPDGTAFSTFMPDIIKGAGLTFVDPGRYQPATEDFTAEISRFKKEGCELLQGVYTTPDYTNFWKQCIQQSWIPKVACIDKGLLFPKAFEAVGDIGIGLTSTMLWGPTWPYKSYLNGESNQAYADAFTKATGEQWSGALSDGAVLEMAAWALQNADDPTSRDSINAAAAKMKFEGMCGPCDFSAPITPATTLGTGHPADHVVKHPAMGGQWVKATSGAFKYNMVSVDNSAAPGIPVDAQPIQIAVK
jgi:branched-chain amino acid transport system substrate-binding protein